MPADPILIYDEEGRERITFVGPYTENQDTKITCKAYGGTALFKGEILYKGMQKYGSYSRSCGIYVQFVSRVYGGTIRYKAYGGTTLFQGSTEVQFVLRAYGGTALFQGPP